jgi:uncharacterized membrane protein
MHPKKRNFMKKIDYSEILKTAWKGLISQIWLLVGLIIGFTIIYSLLFVFGSPKPHEAITISGWIVSVVATVFLLLFDLGFTKNCFQTLDGEEPQFSAYGQMSRKIFTFFVSYIVFGIIVLVGLVLLIIPGIYLALRLQFYMAAIVYEDAGIIDSLKRSWEITKGEGLKLLVLFLIEFLLVLAGMIALFIGIFIAVPLIVLMYCYTFHKLTAPSVTTNGEVANV